MMTDIVARLREFHGNQNYSIMPSVRQALREAADEIERLRKELALANAYISQLIAEKHDEDVERAPDPEVVRLTAEVEKWHADHRFLAVKLKDAEAEIDRLRAIIEMLQRQLA
jgi:chromosome segregation ATPase